MIRKVRLINFRRFRDQTIDFTPGFNVFRAPNEQGKSTILEAIGYALFGVKACREELANVVTWGQPDKSLKVELDIELYGIPYHVTRSKSGAEINYEGGRVVGQTECSNFIANLLGADEKSASRLMFAPQGAIRGALEQGAKATMDLIEKMANFDVIDQVVDLIHGNLLTGPTNVVQDRIDRAQAVVSEISSNVSEPDVHRFNDEVNNINVKLLQERTALADGLKEQFEQVEAKRKELDDVENQRKLLTALKEAEEKKIQGYTAAFVEAKGRANEPVDEHRIIELEGIIRDEAAHRELVKNYEAVQSRIASYPKEFWEGDAASLDAEIEKTQGKIANLESLMAGNRGEKKTLLSHLQTEGKCKACGQDLPNKEAVEKHNAEIKAKCGGLDNEHYRMQQDLEILQADLKPLLDVQKAGRLWELAIASLNHLIDIDSNFVPSKITWKGEPPEPVQDTGEVSAELKRLQAKRQEVVQAKAEVESLLKRIKESEKLEEQHTTGLLALMSEETIQLTRQGLDKVVDEYNLHANEVVMLEQRLKDINDLLNAEVAAWKQRLAEVDKAKQELERVTKEFHELEFNNVLLKRVRAARPIIADKLWTIVLSAVSNYFSEMRGVPSVVTREANSFKVDGEGIGGLSGSALDILGLAIRLALTRTFLPNTPFMVLDEPTAAMDDNRTDATLGFLSTLGLDQILLVSHDEKSESVAQQLITI